MLNYIQTNNMLYTIARFNYWNVVNIYLFYKIFQ